MDIDDFYVKTNSELGRVQKFWYGLLTLFNFYAPFHMIQVVFTGRAPEFECVAGSLTFNNECGPVDNNGTMLVCDVINYLPEVDSFVQEWAATPCQAEVSQWAQMAFMLGVTVGALFLGAIADSVGRKPVLLCSLLTIIGFGTASSFVPTFVTFAALRFFVGIGTAGIMVTSFVLSCEIVGPGVRGFCGNLYQVTYGLGIMGCSGLAYLIQNDWRMLSLASALLGVSLVAVAVFAPESPRWLYAKGKGEDGMRILQRITRSKSECEVAVPTQDEERNCGQIVQVFRVKPLMVIIQVVSWFVNSVVYYALTLSAHSFGSSIYMSTALTGLVELPAYALTGLVIDRVGRRLPLTVFMILAGVSCIVCQIVDTTNESATLYLALFGKLCIAGSFSIVFIQSGELFPTVVRNSGIGLCVSSARIGGVVASYFVSGSITFWGLIVVGGLAICSGCLNLLLPETLNKKLPESLEDLKS